MSSVISKHDKLLHYTAKCYARITLSITRLRPSHCQLTIQELYFHSLDSPVSSNNEEKWEAGLDQNEKLALDAIKSLHRQLDDDKDGNINLDESNEVTFITQHLALSNK